MEIPKATGLFLNQQGVEKEFNDFNQLFGRYLRETGPSVVWSKIHPPPQGSVSLFVFMTTLFL